MNYYRAALDDLNARLAGYTLTAGRHADAAERAARAGDDYPTRIESPVEVMEQAASTALEHAQAAAHYAAKAGSDCADWHAERARIAAAAAVDRFDNYLRAVARCEARL